MKGKLSADKIQIIGILDNYLKDNLLLDKNNYKMWENTYIKKQIDRRKKSEEYFSLQDHIRAMVYSMLSSGASWERISRNADEKTGRIPAVDEIFSDYDVDKLLKISPDELTERLKDIRCGSQYTKRQMETLICENIPKLRKFQKNYKNIDFYYQQWITGDGDLKPLIKQLSDPSSENKMRQMGVPLICEYLKNVGYDVGKPDRHIRRILGSKRLEFSDREIVSEWEALDIIWKLAEKTGRSVAEVDYILWMYCAKGYGEVCRKQNPKCEKCVVWQYCNMEKERS